MSNCQQYISGQTEKSWGLNWLYSCTENTFSHPTTWMQEVAFLILCLLFMRNKCDKKKEKVSDSATTILLNCTYPPSVYSQKREFQIWGKEIVPLNSIPSYVFIATTWDGTFKHWKGHYINRSYCVTA